MQLKKIEQCGVDNWRLFNIKWLAQNQKYCKYKEFLSFENNRTLYARYIKLYNFCHKNYARITWRIFAEFKYNFYNIFV